MAAKMNLCRCLSKLIFHFCVLWFLISSFSISVVYSATQPPTTVDPNANATTDPPTTTAEPTTTTTIPPTTTIAPNEPRTVIGNTVIGQCLCDLTGNECDINCCCDPDCTAADIAVFTCDKRSITVDDPNLCYKEEVFPFSNSPSRTTSDGGLFCIYFDNYKERNYYEDPDFILDIPSFNNYVDRYAKPGLQSPVTVEEPVFDLNSFYKRGDTVYIVYPNQAQGTFVLPAPSISSQCNDQNTVGYLNEVTTECTRTVVLDATTCTGTAGLSASAYYQNFKVVKTSGLFGYVVNGTFVGISTTTQAPPTTTPGTTVSAPPGSNTTDNSTTVAATTTTTTPAPTTTAPITTVDPSLIQTLYNNPYTAEINVTTLTHLCVQADGSIAACTFTTVPDPTFNAATCNNVVQEVRYYFTTDGSNGIAEAQAQFVFRNVQQADMPITQRFSISYNSVSDSNDTFERSGNPGYLIGKPLLYGTLNVTVSEDNVESQEILIPTDPSLGLTVVRPTSSGACADASARIPVKFGENMRTGCQIALNLSTISTTTCQTIQDTIVKTLEGPNVPSLNLDQTAYIENNRYVATFGNTGRLKVGDWVKVIASRRPLPSQAGSSGTDTCSLSMGLHIQVLYANVGALAIPQAKIIGVALLYDAVKEVKFRCEGAFCQPQTRGLTQPFEVSQTVSFIDVSQPATKFAGEAPIFIARVPNDFFYPFLYYTNGASGVLPHIVPVTLIAMATVLLNMKHHIL